LLRTRRAGRRLGNVNVWAKEVLFEQGAPLTERAHVQGSGIQVSALKVRVRWPEYPSREREVLMDIGSGFTISVGPTTQAEVELVVPDEQKFTGVVPPDLRNLRTATYVVASCWAVQAPIGDLGSFGKRSTCAISPDPTSSSVGRSPTVPIRADLQRHARAGFGANNPRFGSRTTWRPSRRADLVSALISARRPR
jgi:hypothetical protein